MLLLTVGLTAVFMPAAIADFQVEQISDRILYKSWQTLRDLDRQSWKAVVFREVGVADKTTVYLRLITFPGLAAIDHSQPLTLIQSGGLLVAPEASNQVFTSPLSQPNVAQYDLRSVLSDLDEQAPVKLLLPTIAGDSISIKVPPIAIQEWQAIAACETMTCDLRSRQ